MPKFSIKTIVSIFAIMTCVMALEALAGENPCDPKLVSTKDRSGYQIREEGIRCEGFYVSEVASRGGLEPVSLLRGHLNFPSDSAAPLIISAPGTSMMAKGPIRVRAVSIPAEIHYRMDAIFVSRDSILWPLRDVIFGSGLTADKIGIFGWTGDESEKTYIPLQVRASGDSRSGQSGPLVLTVRSEVYIDYLEFSIFEVGTGEIEKRKKLIDQLVFPGEPIEIPIPDGHSAELMVTIRAKEYQRARWLPVSTIKIMRP